MHGGSHWIAHPFCLSNNGYTFAHWIVRLGRHKTKERQQKRRSRNYSNSSLHSFFAGTVWQPKITKRDRLIWVPSCHVCVCVCVCDSSQLGMYDTLHLDRGHTNMGKSQSPKSASMCKRLQMTVETLFTKIIGTEKFCWLKYQKSINNTKQRKLIYWDHRNQFGTSGILLYHIFISSFHCIWFHNFIFLIMM